MQIKGEEFIKKVQLQQEREELEKKLNELEEAEKTYVDEDPIIIEESVSKEHELNDIMLDNNEMPNEDDNKKKYLILGIILVVLFLLTIIIIRLLTGDDKEDAFTSSKADSTEMKKIEQNSNIEENFQKIINERIKNNTEEATTEVTTPTSEEKITKVEENTTKNEESIPQSTLDETIKKIEEKTKEIKEEEKTVKKAVEKKTIEKKPVVKKEEPKKTIKNLVQNTSTPSSEIISGYFVQIGAFTKTPSSSYINKIRDAGLKYKVYKVNVKGTMYNKVLIGPYSSRAVANDNIDNIKKKLNLSSAYVLKF